MIDRRTSITNTIRVTAEAQQARYGIRVDKDRDSWQRVCIFGHDGQLATSLEGKDERANKRRNHAGMVPADRRTNQVSVRADE